MNVFEITGSIAVDYSEAIAGLDKVNSKAKTASDGLDEFEETVKNTEKAAETAGEKSETLGEKTEESGEKARDAKDGYTVWKQVLANLATNVISNVINKCKQLATKMADLTTEAVNDYADYEQLVGGVETLYGESADTLIEYADNAYATVQLSANDYMETATSFAAALIQGLGDDTDSAVELSNIAITDMADNANKMGTEIESIQNAYQGFAKQNYTMLDNLKLGYGGTATEMVRLMNDSGTLNKTISDMDEVTFDQIITAIHAVQDNLGITGTSSEEASSTISGSWNSVQAKFENISALVGEQLAPIVMTFLSELSEWLNEVDWTAVADEIGDILDSVINYVEGINFDAVTGKIEDFASSAVPALTGFVEGIVGIISNFDALKNGASIIVSILAGVATAFTVISLSSVKIPTVISSITKAFSSMSTIGLVVAAISAVITIITTLWNTNEGFRNAVISIFNAIKNAITKVMTAIKNVIGPVWNAIKATVVTVVTAIKTNVVSIFNKIKTALTPVLNAIKTVISTVFKAIKTVVVVYLGLVLTYVSTIWNAIAAIIKVVLTQVWPVVKKIFIKIKNIIVTVMNTIKAKITPILNKIKTIFTTVFNAVKKVVSKVFNTIKSVITTVLNKVKSIVSTVVGAIKKIFDKFNDIKETVFNAIEPIVDKFNTVFNGIKSIVKPIVTWLKNIFNFKWTMPKIKLPHFSISPEGWKIKDLLKGTIPTLNVEWYAKAMKDGMIMTSPTVFGYDSGTGNLLAGGEAGSEAVVGTSSLYNMIQSAVNSQNVGVVAGLNKLASILTTYLPQINDQMSTNIVLDSGVLVGQTASLMNKELGKIYKRR